MALLIVDAQF